MDSVTRTVTEQICKIRGQSIDQAETTDLERNLYDDFGLSSMEMVMLMTVICDQTKLPMTTLSEADVASLQTPAAIINLIKNRMD